MKQLKVFTGSSNEVWRDANKWLRENADVVIYGFMQSESFDGVWSLTITIIYKEKVTSPSETRE